MTDLVLLVFRSSALIALALVIVACLSRWSAAMRHRVLALAFCGAIVVGPLVSIVPAWPVLPSPSMALSSAAISASPAPGEPSPAAALETATAVD